MMRTAAQKITARTKMPASQAGLIAAFASLLVINMPAQAEIAPEIATGMQQIKTSESERWMAVTANNYATQAAADILANGGSAVDAAIAAQLVLGLVEPQSSGIGGGGFLVHWDAENSKLSSFNGRESAPADVDEDHFLNNGKNMGFFDAVVGGHAVGTPGLLHMLHNAHQLHGQLKWEQLFQPAITLAEQGFVISPRLHQLLRHMQQTPNGIKDPNMAAYFLTSGGQIKAAGSTLKNPDYANTLKTVAQSGIAAFYQGPIAEAIAEAVQNNAIRPGSLSVSDLKKYNSQVNDAVCSIIEQYKVCGAALPASGPTTVIQILHMLSKTAGFYGLAADSTAFYHRFAEASKLAFSDRDKYLADPDYIDVPLAELLSEQYLNQRATQIPLMQASAAPAEAGIVSAKYSFAAAQSAEIPSTTHLSIVDDNGNIVSMTSSIEMAFGSQIMVQGFLLNNQLTDFSFAYEDTQHNKVANRIQAGKRPRSSMAPMIVFNKHTEKPVFVVGSPGGSRIIDYVAKTIAQHTLLQQDLATAIDSPHVVNLNGTTEIEKGALNSSTLAQQLQKLGHKITSKDQTSGLHAINMERGRYIGVADKRREGSAIGD